MTKTTITRNEGEVVGEVPTVDMNDPGHLEAWYGNFAFFDHYRKIVLASCRETERAKALTKGEKITETRLDDLARVSDTYVEFIALHLGGRALREQNVLLSQVLR
jgi:hypothetical protein